MRADFDLLSALRAVDVAAARSALEAGASADVRDGDGRTAMHYLCLNWTRMYALAPLVLHAGGNIWREDKAGVMPIDLLLDRH